MFLTALRWGGMKISFGNTVHKTSFSEELILH